MIRAINPTMSRFFFIGALAMYFRTGSAGCCSLKYKSCDATWCGTTEEQCLSCSPGVYWLESGALDSTCSARWKGCANNACCPGLTCRPNTNNWMQCLSDFDAPVIITSNFTTPSPTSKPAGEPSTRPTMAPVNPPTKLPTEGPTSSPSTRPTSSPTRKPTASPTPRPSLRATVAPMATGDGCCSQKFLVCDGTWCGATKAACESCSADPGAVWLTNGALAAGTCLPRWDGCQGDPSGCCEGATCRDNGGGWLQCLADTDDPPIGNPVAIPSTGPESPVTSPTPQPTPATVVSPSVKPTQAPVAPTSPTSSEASEGKATYYGGNVAGNACGFIDLPTATFPYGYSAAGGGDVFDDGYGCGSCFQITCTGPNGYNPSCYCDGTTPTVTVQVTDQCPECDDSHFDLNTEAFTYIVGDGLAGTCGIIDTLWERVNCPFETNIRIRSKSGTSQWWYGLHVDHVAGYGDLSSVSLRRGGTSDFDVSCDKSGGSTFWLCNFSASDPLVLPLDVQLTDSAGRTLYGYGVITSFAGGAAFDFGANFENI